MYSRSLQPQRPNLQIPKLQPRMPSLRPRQSQSSQCWSPGPVWVVCMEQGGASGIRKTKRRRRPSFVRMPLPNPTRLHQVQNPAPLKTKAPVDATWRPVVQSGEMSPQRRIHPKPKSLHARRPLTLINSETLNPKP